jgi:hypothetical protein
MVACLNSLAICGHAVLSCEAGFRVEHQQSCTHCWLTLTLCSCCATVFAAVFFYNSIDMEDLFGLRHGLHALLRTASDQCSSTCSYTASRITGSANSPAFCVFERAAGYTPFARRHQRLHSLLPYTYIVLLPVHVPLLSLSTAWTWRTCSATSASTPCPSSQCWARALLEVLVKFYMYLYAACLFDVNYAGNSLDMQAHSVLMLC